MGMATVSSAQSKCVNVGGDSCCSVSSFHDSGGMLFRGCGLLTRGVGAIGTCGVDVINAVTGLILYKEPNTP